MAIVWQKHWTNQEMTDLMLVVKDISSSDEFTRVCAQVAVMNLVTKYGKQKWAIMLNHIKTLEERHAKRTSGTETVSRTARD